MGIRFHCPNGHKLHVKSFLAGKKGICPDCGAKMEIPYQSTRSSSKGEGSNPVSQAPPETPLAMPVEPRHAGAPPQAAQTAATENSGPQQSAAQPAQPLGGTIPNQPATSAPFGQSFGSLPHPTQPTERATAVPMGRPATNQPQPTPPSMPGPTDPIDEAPQAVWYARPKTGGQYGPAPGDVFRRWLEEGRVASDSLVWREGWPEWKLASESFAKFAQASSTPATQPPTAPGDSFTSIPVVADSTRIRSPEQQRLVAKRNTANATIMFIIVLVLALAALVPVLFWVVMSR